MTDKKKYYTGTAKTDPPYLPDPALVDAVNLAIMLERPLLLKGEPGCGKTRLAKAVADELGYRYEAWPIKSTARAKDGLYTYDALRHLRETQLRTFKPSRLAFLDKMLTTFKPVADYIHDGPLGRAFGDPEPTVVLIDEIDKADLDFPNDLLHELEERRYYIPETQSWKPEDSPGTAPLIIITSNNEKELPDAFLRRCLFFYIEFPTAARLVEIVKAHCGDTAEGMVEQAVDQFMRYRQQMTGDKGPTDKKVSTSELIDWFKIKQHPDREKAIHQLDKETVPYWPVLLKNQEDYIRYIAKAKQKK